jgi:SAM-dependent methyltransferase
MFSHTRGIILAAEQAVLTGEAEEGLQHLRHLSLDDFGQVLFGLPDDSLPNLSAVFPRMPSDDVQKSWTGHSGLPLLQRTSSFVRSVAYNCQNLLGHGMEDRTILDFGCGYGRIIRLMYYYSSPARIWGLDPWEKSIELCRADGVLGQLAVSDYLPTALPVGDVSFDLIYAFSVFTHLSERAATLALTTLRRYVARGGLFVITIRPKEYWDVLDPEVAARSHIDRDELVARHERNGFAFVPDVREAIDGEVTYGHTSLSFEWIEQHAEGWNMVGYDHSLIDPFQLLVYLVPKHHKVWRRLLRFPCKLSNAPSTRSVFKQKFEESDRRKENESQARTQCQDG